MGDEMSDKIQPLSFRPADFCLRNGIGMTTFYRLVNEGQITARKIGKATVVLIEDEQAWRASLPKRAEMVAA